MLSLHNRHHLGSMDAHARKMKALGRGASALEGSDHLPVTSDGLVDVHIALRSSSAVVHTAHSYKSTPTM